MSKGIVFSDTHLFSSRSDAFVRMEEVYPHIRSCEVCVLNGDIFDFRWTILSTLEETVQRAGRWLEDLVKAYPEVTFYYVTGNHDAHPLFLKELESIVSSYGNIHSVRYHLQIENHLFLHGDTIHAQDRTLEALDKYRSLFAYTEKQSFTLDLFFRILIALRGPNIATALENIEVNCKKIHEYIDLHLPATSSQISQVYYGHTHNPFQKHVCDGRAYTNTGSMIKNLDFRVEHFEYLGEESAIFYK